MNKSTHLDLPLRANAAKGKKSKESKRRAKGQKNKRVDRKSGYLGAEGLCKLSIVREVTATSQHQLHLLHLYEFHVE